MENKNITYKNYILPYVRLGFSNTKVGTQSGASVEIKAKVGLGQVGEDEKIDVKEITRRFKLAGPECVRSLKDEAVSKITPADKTVGKSYDYMPYIEFYEEDLPWRYTPMENQQKLEPWMVLVALKEGEFTLNMDLDTGYQVLKVESAASDIFPNKEDFYQYAHVEINAPAGLSYDELLQYVKDHPEKGFSRLLCHRPLERLTRYWLFLLPAFETGRRAGLGLNTEGADVKMHAWEPKDAEGLREGEYPVYKMSTMMSGEETFQNLAKRLGGISMETFKQLPTHLDVNIDDVYQYTEHPTEGKSIEVPMALGTGAPLDKSKQEDSEATAVVKELLEKNPVFYSNQQNEYEEEADPWIVPPVYGARQTLATLQKGTNYRWSTSEVVDDINLHLRNRLVAGLGSQVVKEHQEELVNRAWSQVEQVNKANQILREMVEMNRINAAAEKKGPSALKEKEVDQKMAGLNTDAARKITVGGRIYNVDNRKLMDEAKELDAVEKKKTVPYELGQGISSELLDYMCKTSNWREEIQNCLKNTMAYRLLYSEDNLKLFMHLRPDLRWMPHYGLSIRKHTPDKNTTKLNLYGTDPKTHEKYPKAMLQIEPKVYDQCIFFEDVYKMHHRDNIDIRRYTRVIDHKASSYMNCTYDEIINPDFPTENWFGNMFLPYRFKDDATKDIGFFMPDHKFKYLVNHLPIVNTERQGAAAPEYLLFDVFEKFPENDPGVGTKGTKRKMYILPESLVKKYHKSMYINENWYTEELGNWAIPDGMKLELGIVGTSYRGDEEHPAIVFGLKDRDSVQVDELLKAKDGYKRSNPKKVLFSNNHPLSINSLWYKLNELEEFLTEHNRVAGHSLSVYTWKTTNHLIYDEKERSLFIVDTPFAFPRQVTFQRGWHETEFGEEYDFFSIHKDEASGKCYAVIQGVQTQNLLRMVQELISAIVRAESCFWFPQYVELNEAFKKLPHRQYDYYELTDMQKMADDYNQLYDHIGELLSKLNEDVFTEEEVKETKETFVFEENDASKQNEKKMKELIEHFYQSDTSFELDKLLCSRYPVMAYPIFPEPTSFYLTELSQKYLLPAVDKLANNSICTFLSSPEFEEAFLAGMNTEMGRELLWREYPTDERGSYFRKFWSQEKMPDKFDDTYYDTKMMHLWDRPLGQNHTPSAHRRMYVFVIKGDLMRIYPDFGVYISTKEGAIIEPDMTGWLNNDTFMVGFRHFDEVNVLTDYLTLKEKERGRRFACHRLVKEGNSAAFAKAKSCTNTLFHIPLINVWNL